MNTRKRSVWQEVDANGDFVPIQDVLQQSPFQTEEQTDPHRGLRRNFLLLWDRLVDEYATLPLTPQTLSIWIRCEIEDVNGYLFSVATIDNLKWLMEIARVGMDGHKTLMQVQPQIIRALAQEKQAQAAGRRLDQTVPARRILEACARIYQHAIGTPEHILAAADLVRACNLIH